MPKDDRLKPSASESMEVIACLEPMTEYVSGDDREPTAENTMQSETKYAGSSLETMTGKDRLKLGIHEGMDMNHILTLKCLLH
jgi:hypothetical protein